MKNKNPKAPKELTKQWLIDHNIEVEGERVFHTSERSGRVELKPAVVLGPKTRGRRMKYKHVAFYGGNYHQYSFPLQRVIYAWNAGVAHADMVIDHINNDPLDNRFENLQEITQTKNLQRKING